MATPTHLLEAMGSQVWAWTEVGIRPHSGWDVVE